MCLPYLPFHIVGVNATEAIKQIALAAAVYAESDSDLDLGTVFCSVELEISHCPCEAELIRFSLQILIPKKTAMAWTSSERTK
jgi:hypothetical protein